MAEWQDPDEEDDEYFAEIQNDVELTGLEPKFVRIPSMDTAPSVLATMKVDELILLYRQARDQLATDRKGFEARKTRVKTHLMIISMLLRDRGDALGVDNFATANGTAYRNRKEKFPITGWPEFSQWILTTGNIHLLQKRVSPNAVKEVREAEGALPPGLDCLVEIEFAVRSPTVRKSKT